MRNWLKIAKSIVSADPDLDFTTEEDPLPESRWQVQPHEDSPCFKYPCNARAMESWGKFQEGGLYQILGEDNGKLVVKDPTSSGVLHGPSLS